jgi:hypothetical protein
MIAAFVVLLNHLRSDSRLTPVLRAKAVWRKRFAPRVCHDSCAFLLNNNGNPMKGSDIAHRSKL